MNIGISESYICQRILKIMLSCKVMLVCDLIKVYIKMIFVATKSNCNCNFLRKQGNY